MGHQQEFQDLTGINGHCAHQQFTKGRNSMKESVVRLKNLCEMMISMGFAESANEAEIKKLITSLETIIYEEMKLLKERESMSDM